MKQNILVTGANGFLGSYVMDAFAKLPNINLIAAVRDKSKLPKDFSGEIREGDLRDKDYCTSLVQDVDVICHTAAWTSLWRHKRQEQTLFRNPTIQLIDAAVTARVRRFIWDSSVVLANKHNTDTISDSAPAKRRSFWPHLNAMADIEEYMQSISNNGTKMISLRCGHFIGPRSNLGVVTVLLPRLKTHLVPWVSGGKARQPLVAGEDIAQAFCLAASRPLANDFLSLNICGPDFPSAREILNFLHDEVGTPLPHYSVPLSGAYAFGWLMETLHLILPGQPLLTQPIAYLGEDHYAPNTNAKKLLGYQPQIDWKTAIRQQLADEQKKGFPSRKLAGDKTAAGSQQ